jgi:hypothetical protein
MKAILNSFAPINPAPNVICPVELANVSSDNSVPLYIALLSIVQPPTVPSVLSAVLTSEAF